MVDDSDTPFDGWCIPVSSPFFVPQSISDEGYSRLGTWHAESFEEVDNEVPGGNYNPGPLPLHHALGVQVDEARYVSPFPLSVISFR